MCGHYPWPRCRVVIAVVMPSTITIEAIMTSTRLKPPRRRNGVLLPRVTADVAGEDSVSLHGAWVGAAAFVGMGF